MRRPRDEDHAPLVWHVSPANQGQIVVVSYATTGDGRVLRSTFNRSSNTSDYDISRMLRDDRGDYWNDEPKNRRWRSLTAEELRWFGLREG